MSSDGDPARGAADGGTPGPVEPTFSDAGTAAGTRASGTESTDTTDADTTDTTDTTDAGATDAAAGADADAGAGADDAMPASADDGREVAGGPHRNQSRADDSAPAERDLHRGVPTRGSRPRNDTDGPELPDDIQFSDLDPEARRELRSLAKSVAELVGRHLVAAGQLIDEDPEQALVHARFARSRAARVAIVREAAGITAYHAGEWAEALGELRAVRRMTGDSSHLPVMVDCERALGRPERALDLAAEAGKDLPRDVAVELRIVAAGARRDMGQVDAAVVALQGPDLDPAKRDPWSARLFYAYADNLEAAGRTDEAIRWFLNAAEADLDEETDAGERAIELGAP